MTQFTPTAMRPPPYGVLALYRVPLGNMCLLQVRRRGRHLRKWEQHPVNHNGNPVRVPMHVKTGDLVKVGCAERSTEAAVSGRRVRHALRCGCSERCGTARDCQSVCECYV